MKFHDLSQGNRARPSRPPRGLTERAYTSREAAQVSGVPFFTVDYWGRTKFLIPTVAPGAGRGKGRQRIYSYGDVLRLSIARELRDQKVSLETLRTIIHKLAAVSAELPTSHFVLVGREVEMARSITEMQALLRRAGRRTFGVLLDLRTVTKTVRSRARELAADRLAAVRDADLASG
jgi:DNA-binding transcriptional MerR regulator